METNNKLREACQKMLDLLILRGDGKARCILTWDEFNESYMMLRAALAEPVRNCDVGTAEEQIDRMLEFCGRKGKCTRCEHHKIGTMFRECTLRWAQMPYE